MKDKLTLWGPWENNPSKEENFYDDINEKVEIEESAADAEKEEPDHVSTDQSKKELEKKKKAKKRVRESIDLDEATHLEPDLE